MNSDLNYVTLFLTYGEKYPHALVQLKDCLRRLSLDEYPLVVIDNAVCEAPLEQLPDGSWRLGGDNTNGEFSGWEKARAAVTAHPELSSFDAALFVNDSFQNYGGSFLEKITRDQLDAHTAENNALGHVSFFDAPADIFNSRLSFWIRSNAFLLPAAVLKAIPNLCPVTDEGLEIFLPEKFNGTYFRPDAPISQNLREHIIRWLSEGWHSKFVIKDNRPLFERKLKAILNEKLLTAAILERGFSVRHAGKTQTNARHELARPSLEDLQALIANGKSADALELLHRHYLPGNDMMADIVHADALKSDGQLTAAIPVYRDAALRGGQHSLTLWRRIFETQMEAGDIDAALITLRQALSLAPGDLELHQQAARLLFSSTLHFQAGCHARHILEKSTEDDTLAMAENVYRFSMQPFEAYQVVKKRRDCAADPNLYLGLVLCGAQGICEWDTVTECARTLDTQYYAKGDFTTVREIPLYNIARIADEAVNLAVAQAATRHLEEVAPAFDLSDRFTGKDKHTGKIRVGLLSADFSSHPVIQLIIGLFEHMDKSKFELFAFDDGKNDPNGETRMLAAMDKHIDVREHSHMAVAQRVYDEKIDILIDLMGLTTKNRQEVLALRPCPVTAVFLGFPGTCGLSKIDYIITDATITPDSSKPHYAEKLCRLPEVFMPNDEKRLIADNPVTRADVGLPEDAVVFCSFNRSFKLDEESVNLWMRILARVPGSVLWQKADEAHMKRVFLNAAARHGIAAERIIFAGNTSSVSLHLARAGLADLGLDTLIYNGHTITSDMLWAGVPVITREGTHFASRVSASLLRAVGLDDCVAESIEAMEDLAVSLATNPARRAALRERLRVNKTFMPLYDTERYTRHFEAALAMMLDRARQGIAPDHIDVPRLPPPLPARRGPGRARVHARRTAPHNGRTGWHPGRRPLRRYGR